MSETANWAYPQIDRAPGELDDNYLKRLLAQSTFYVWVEKSDFPMRVWWKPRRYGAYSSWQTVPEGILNHVESDHLHNSTVQMAGVIALFGDQIPDWMRVNLSDADLIQRTVRPTPGDLLNKVIETQAHKRGVAVEDLVTAMARKMQEDPDLISHFVDSVINLDDTTDEHSSSYDYSDGSKSSSIVTSRTR